MITRTVATTTAILAMSSGLALSAAAPAAAATSRLHVTTVSSPAWVAHKALPVAVSIRTSHGKLYCSPMAVTVT